MDVVAIGDIINIWSYPNKTMLYEGIFFIQQQPNLPSIHPSKPIESIFIIIKFLALPNEFSLFSIKTISMNMINCLVFYIDFGYDKGGWLKASHNQHYIPVKPTQPHVQNRRRRSKHVSFALILYCSWQLLYWLC